MLKHLEERIRLQDLDFCLRSVGGLTRGLGRSAQIAAGVAPMGCCCRWDVGIFWSGDHEIWLPPCLRAEGEGAGSPLEEEPGRQHA